jgi:flavodoxin
MASPNVLVVFYSDTGHTRAAAERVAEALEGEVEAIAAPGLGRGVVGFVTRVWTALRGRGVEIEPAKHDPDAYDLVVVGAPVWANHVATPTRAYLERHAASLPAVGFLVTLTGDQPGGALADMTRIVGHDPVASTAINDADRRNGHDAAKLRDFVRTLKSAPASAA